jgi:molybdate transport system substrate-binding protein
VVVFAAASLKTALDAVAADFQAATGDTVTISYAGTGQLATQIIQGAPADIFLSAAANWMDEVETAGLVVPGTRQDLLGNTLVLIAHGKDAAPVTLAPGVDLAALLGQDKLAMAMVDSVPAGQYGKEARARRAGLGIGRGALWHRLCVGRRGRRQTVVDLPDGLTLGPVVDAID